MKRASLILILLLSVTIIHSQDKGNTRVPVIGEKAPSFTVQSTNGEINFPKDFGRSWKVLFSHPADFTPVCSSEVLELAYMQAEFDKLNTKFLVLSVDSLNSHKDWKKALEEINYKDRGKVNVTVPIASDRKYRVSRQYGMIHDASSDKRTVRGVFIIDPENTIQTVLYYPMNVGRNMDEIKRTIIALQTVANKNISTPANWQVGNDILLHVKPTEDEVKNSKGGIYELSWFMIYKKL
jgi:peroxiredoxin (alkyl hydroperoxide reductase subunit C)